MLAILFPVLLLVALGLGAYCCYNYATNYVDSWEHQSGTRESNIDDDILEDLDENGGIEDILAEEE